LINSLPSNWSTDDLKHFIQQIQAGGQYFFMTDLSLTEGHSIYGKFGSNWNDFMDAMGSFDG